MEKKTIIGITIFIFLAVLSSIIFYNFSISGDTNIPSGENKVILLMFYGKGCPHCATLEKYLGEIEKNDPNLIINRYEIYFNQENRKLLEELSSKYNTEVQGVPTVFIDKKVFVGANSVIEKEISDEIKKCEIEGCINPLEKIKGEEATTITGESSSKESPETTKLKKNLTIPAVILAALVDSINPCEFAILIILLTTILASGNRKKALFAGLAFSLSIFISYFLMGLGLYSAIQASGLTHTFYIIVAVLAIILGLFNLKDYFWYGKWFLTEVPLLWRPKMNYLIKSISSVPGAFLIGFVISLFLLPCTSGPYIVILGLLANLTTKNYAILLLVFYNIIFILPMLGITLGIYLGITTTEKAEEWRTRKLKKLHLIAGVIILLLGIGMIISILMGWM